MDAFAQLSVIMLIMFVLLVAFLAYKTKKRPSRSKYMSVAVFSLFIIASVFGILGHMGWCCLIILIGALLGAVLMPSTIEDSKVEITKALKKVDASEPIRIKDFFIGVGLTLKLKRKYGANKAMTIQLTYNTILNIVIFTLVFYLLENLIFINDRAYRGLNWQMVMGPLIIWSIIFTYINIKRVMNVAEKNSTSSVKANFCTSCGSPITPDAIFCTNCGKQIN